MPISPVWEYGCDTIWLWNLVLTKIHCFSCVEYHIQFTGKFSLWGQKLYFWRVGDGEGGGIPEVFAKICEGASIKCVCFSAF